MTDQMPAGWYYAQGDPPGTNRYWDGQVWQGEAVATQNSPTDSAPFASPNLGGGYGGPTRQPGGIGSRFVAYLIDAGIVWVIMILSVVVSTALSGSEEPGALFYIGFLGAFGFGIWNFLIRQGQTGQTIGKGVMNVALLDNKTLAPIGIGKVFVRLLLGAVINAFLWIGYIVALFDKNNQRLTDKVLDSNVYQA